jgi:hypothetical protein
MFRRALNSLPLKVSYICIYTPIYVLQLRVSILNFSGASFVKTAPSSPGVSSDLLLEDDSYQFEENLSTANLKNYILHKKKAKKILLMIYVLISSIRPPQSPKMLNLN